MIQGVTQGEALILPNDGVMCSQVQNDFKNQENI